MAFFLTRLSAAILERPLSAEPGLRAERQTGGMTSERRGSLVAEILLGDAPTRRRSSISNLLRARTKMSRSNHSSSKDDAINHSVEELDPVYMAIKQAGELYTKSRSNGVPKKKSHASAADLVKQDSLGSRGSLSSGARGSDPSIQHLRVSSAGRKVSGSSEEPPKPTGEGVAVKLRAPHLDLKMKSLSLDSPDATPYTLNLSKNKGRRGNRSASPNSAAAAANRLLSAPRLIKNCSIETDETDATSASASPCPSPYNAGSASSLTGGPPGAEPIGWVATREYRQRFPEDLGLSPGDIVHIVDTSDPEWYHGFKPGDDHVGIFPVACVARVYAGERVAQVVQNLSLSHPPRHLRLHKDQILFTHGQVGREKTIGIRTAKNYKATCPVQYLMFLT